MKRNFLLLFSFFLLISSARAEDFTLKETAILSGMNSSWRQGYEPAVENGFVNVCLPLVSERAKGPITVSLLLDDESVSPFVQTERTAQIQRDNGLYAARLRLRLIPARHAGDYAATVVVTGKDAEGNRLKSVYPVVIRVRDGIREASRPALTGVCARLVTGEDGMISARLTNAGRYAEMRDIELTISDPEGGILPQGAGRMYLGSLMPGKSTDIYYPVSVKPDAAAALRAVAINLTYTALDEDKTWTEHITLPVKQEIRLERGETQAPSSVIQGDTATFILPLMNMGRGELQNVMATLSFPGISARPSALVGSLSPGETKQAKVSLTPGRDALGEVNGELIVTAEDDWGNGTGFSLPVTLNVEKAPEKPAEILTAADYVKAGVPGYVWPLGGGCLVLLIALIVQGALLRGRIHRMEEDRL